MHRSTEDHFSEYRRNGYTIFQNFMPPNRLQHIRQTVDAEFRRRHTQHPDRIRASIANVLADEQLGPFSKDFNRRIFKSTF